MTESFETDSFETVIVGTGVAATIVADSLLRANPTASILMLEAGERIPLRARSEWWGLALRGERPYGWTYDDEATESHSKGGTEWGFRESRVRAYGGSTMHWGGWSLRFQEEDFECFFRTGRGADWPFGYRELEPWYEQAEAVLGVGGDASDPDGPPRRGPFPNPPFPWTAHESELAGAFEAVGLRPGHMPIARFHRCMTTGTCKYCPIGARYTATDHLDEVVRRGHANLRIRCHAPVVRVDADRHRVHGVTYRHGDEERSVRAERVVLCAGAYESPKLLLASVSPDWPQGLGNRHDQVGRYLVTHSMLRVIGKKPENPERWFQEYDFPTLMSRSWDAPKWQRRGKVFVFNNRSRPKVDLAAHMIAGRRREEVDRIAAGEREGGLDAFIEEFGVRDNRVQLGSGAGKFGLPQTEVHFTRSTDMQPASEQARHGMEGFSRRAAMRSPRASRSIREVITARERVAWGPKRTAA